MKMAYFLFDENLSPSYSKAIQELESKRSNRIVISTTQIPKLGKAASDKEIIDYALNLNSDCYILTQDRDFRKRILFNSIMTSTNMGLFHIYFPKGSNFWNKFKYLINIWEDIIEKTSAKSNPIAYSVSGKSKFIKM